MQAILTIIITLLIITILVFVHELGHFLAAKFFKVDVQEFAIGFGKRIFSKKYRGTLYSIRLLPLGGFVNLEGERESQSPNGFRNIRAFKKIIILFAGVFFNLIFAFIVFTFFTISNDHKFSIPALTDFSFQNTEQVTKAYPLLISEVDPVGNSMNQLFKDEIIVGVNDIRFNSYKEFQNILKENQEKKVNFEFIDLSTYKTNTREISLGKADLESGAILGVKLIELNRNSQGIAYPVYFIKYENSILSGFFLTRDLTLFIPASLFSLVTTSVSSGNFNELGNSVGGPLQIINQSNDIVQTGVLDPFIPFAGLLSISLAVFNILPFPALDGGQIVVVLVEKLRRKKISDELLEKINFGGFVFLIIFALLVTFKDFVQLDVLSRIGDFINNLR